MRTSRPFLVAAAIALSMPLALAQQPPPGASLAELLAIAKAGNPDLSLMRYDAVAAAERVLPAGALPDPMFGIELRDITRMGEQSPTLSPSRVGSTRYQLRQDLPWFGKRDLKREIAQLDADGYGERARGLWVEVAAKLKSIHAQLYFLSRSERLTREILDLMARLEQVALARYAGGLVPQQDAIRAQVEQTGMRNELISLEAERRQAHLRMNALLGRPANAPLAEPASPRLLPPPERLDLAELERRARLSNPTLTLEEARIKAAEKGRELTYKGRYPDFTLGIAPIQYQNKIKEWELMFEMNIPLQQDARRAQERESEAMLAAARARQEAAVNQVLAELGENLVALDNARRIEASVTSGLLPQADLTLRSALAGYETGKVDFATLLDAQRQIRMARQSIIKAQSEAQARLAGIERILGDDL